MAGALLWLADPEAVSLTIGLPVALAGLALRAWAAGHLEKDRELAESGPYAHVRNPLYAGSAAVAAGFVIASRRWEPAVLALAVFALVYLPAVQLEEEHLRSLFPRYGPYTRRVPALWPRITPSPGEPKAFRWALYLRNREHHALAGFAAAAAALLWKAAR
jgi:protein-S-isoprenylcysteine O-methyltransferase Ste14